MRRTALCLTVAATVATLTVSSRADSEPSTVQHHIMTAGQSLGLGVYSTPILPTLPQYSNRTIGFHWADGIKVRDGLVPIFEDGYPHGGETPLTGMISTLSLWRGDSYIGTRHGHASASYDELKKGTPYYEDGMIDARLAQKLVAAESPGHTTVVDAVVITHGESDNTDGGNLTSYTANLEQWQRDYDADIRAITGQTQPVVLVIDQMSSYWGTSAIPFAQWNAARNNPDSIMLMGPKYFLEKSPLDTAGGIHLSNAGSRLLGEYQAKVVDAIQSGRRWVPLSPQKVTYCANRIDLTLSVPAGAGPVRFDTKAVAPAANYGFELGNAGTRQIQSVQTTGWNKISVTLNANVDPAMRLRYAYTGRTQPATTTFTKGNVRDSDPRVGASGVPLPNWLIHFDEPVATQDCTAPPTARPAPERRACVPTIGKRLCR
jgi:hypothetical protein